ncbi:MAG: prolyl oligopeptidase family serine peptidase, partial [Pseudomonadota bacterium]
MTDKPPTPPTHRQALKRIEKFGVERQDPYAWMKPADWQAVLKDPASLDEEIRAAIEKENAYTEAYMAQSAALMHDIKNQLSLIKERTAIETGVVRGDYFFFETKSESGEAFFGRRNLNTGEQKTLLDMDRERERNPRARLSWGGPKLSPDATLFGWAVDETGSGSFAVNVRHIDSGEMRVCNVRECHGAFAFDKQGRYLFWVGRDWKGRSACVWRRNIDDGTDIKCFEYDDPAYFIDLKTSSSGEYIFIRVLNGDQSETWFIPSAAPTDAPAVIEPMSRYHDYDVEHWRDKFIIRTNTDDAEDFKIVSAPLDAPQQDNWSTLTPHVSGRYITSVTPFFSHLVRFEWRDAKPRLVITSMDGSEYPVDFADEAYAIDLTPQQDYQSDFVSYVYSSPVSPKKLCKTKFRDRRSSPLLENHIAQTFDAQKFGLKRLDIIAEDGALIPLTLLYRRDSPPCRDQPLYMYAYGAYGEIMEETFRPEAIALAERGWTFAIAHIRGGGERGSSWWRSTLKHGKKATFSDFTTCAEALVAQGLAGKGNIVCHGMSAGGLLMGSVFASHPHLWAGVIAQVPFVDILNTLDDWQNHPLGSTPFAIWGDPRIEA